ncbi:MAG: amylo-alpha-1,6-glucosidase [Candidatus Hodarchaeales archaeon]
MFSKVKIILLFAIIGFNLFIITGYNTQEMINSHSIKKSSIAQESKTTSVMNIVNPISDLEELGLTVLSTEPHEYVLSNRDKLHWTSETNKEETRKWQGLVKDRWTTLTNIWLDVSSKTTPSNVLNTTVQPHQVQTRYNTSDGTFTESIFLPLHRDAMVVQYISDFDFNGSNIRPQFGMRKDWSAGGSNYQTTFDETNQVLWVTTTSTDYYGPKYVGIKLTEPFIFMRNEKSVIRTYPKDDYRGDGSSSEYVYEAGSLSFNLTANNQVNVIIALGDTQTEVLSILNDGISNLTSWWSDISNHFLSILNKTNIQTGNQTWDKALRWALLSLDSLTMNATGRGIYAGYHWFPEYWGRDSFISFPGAALITGTFEMGKEWIKTMIQNQDTDPSSPTYGRVPNIIQPNANNYETTDGTGWFIRSIWSYLQYSADYDFMTEVWPSVKTAILGEITRTDSLGFLTHGDRETWMDAMTQGIIASPRGNRAVEIQSLWFTELDIGQRIARLVNENEYADTWYQRMKELRDAFQEYFWDPIDLDLYDHLNLDGTSDYQKRPNIIFAITVPLLDNPLLTPKQASLVLNSVIQNTVVAHGVRSLSSSDSDYHPLHDYGSRQGIQHHDFSYHNGDVWLWLSGPVIEASILLGRTDIAQQLTEVLLQRVLTRDTLGSLGEIMDGTDVDPLGHSRGTISQAWSLAELLRVYYQGWLGITPDALNRTVVFNPQLPTHMTKVITNVRQNEGYFKLIFEKTSLREYNITFELYNYTAPLNLTIRLPDHPTFGTPVFVDSETQKTFTIVQTSTSSRYSISLLNFLNGNKTFSVNYNGTKPVFDILNPSRNISYEQGVDIPFEIDLNEPYSEIKWISDLDGTLSSDKSFSKSNLSKGVHEITVSVKNDAGTAFQSFNLIIGNIAPIGRVVFPKTGTTANGLNPINFKSKIRDDNPEDDPDTMWISNIDNHFLTGETGSVMLSTGIHNISVIFTDQKENTTDFLALNVIIEKISLDGLATDWDISSYESNSFNFQNEIVVWTDAEGDDTGDGDYTYPTFNLPWSGDLAQIQITSDSSSLYFLVVFNRPAVNDPIWAQRMSSIMIGLDFSGNSGLSPLTTIFASSHPLSLAVDDNLDPEVVIYATAQGELLIKDNSGALEGANAVASNGNLIEIKLPWSILDSYIPTEEFVTNIVAATFLYDDTGSGFGAGGARQVSTTRSEWAGGGGDSSSWNPNVYDLAFVNTTEIQEEILSSYILSQSYATLTHGISIKISKTLNIIKTTTLPRPLLSTPTFIYPSGGETLNEIITIQWGTVTDDSGFIINYDLYYSVDNGNTWIQLVSGLSNTSYSWNTRTVTNNANYLIKVVATHFDDFEDEDVSGTFSILNHYLSKPIIVYPEGDNLVLSDLVLIQWNLVNDTLEHSVNYSLYYSNDDGNNWILIASGLNTTNYQWDTTFVINSDNYLIKIVAMGSEGLITETLSTTSFTISNIPITPTSSEIITTSSIQSSTSSVQTSMTTDTKTSDYPSVIILNISLIISAIFHLMKKKSNKKGN